MHNEEFRRAIEAIKLRAPIEDVVRERLPALKKAGTLWVACCPFHEEKTPSFKVDPRRGFWYCYGACGTGGDQIAFLQRLDNLGFLDVIETLAARTGIELPALKTGPDRRADEAGEASAWAVLDEATRFYRRQLATPEGLSAARYFRSRGLSEATGEGFAIGYAPASGQALVEHLRSSGFDLAPAETAGLVRRSDPGRAYDFFRGRLMIPIRDGAGRTVGFGARRLDDSDASGPKYINTADTPQFHKGRLIYALDRALSEIRRERHVILVEGYTDVMAAHQAGIANVVAVLGTSTTEEHAALIRKTGARRVTLVFDGDAAGRKAAYKALHGLLPLDVEIFVVSLNGVKDPCDLLTRAGGDGSKAFRAEIDLAHQWFEFLIEGLQGLAALERAREVDRVLELLARLRKPVQRDSLMQDLAQRLSLPVSSLREEWRALGARTERRPSAVDGSREAEARGGERASSADASTPVDPRHSRAFEEIIGSLLCDASLVPLARPFSAECPDPDLARILAAIFELYADEDATIEVASVMDHLAGHPARNRVVPIFEHARSADSPRALIEGPIQYLKARKLDLERRELEEKLRELERIAMVETGEARAAAEIQAIELSKRLYANRELTGEFQAR